jgi:hypothetical protein
MINLIKLYENLGNICLINIDCDIANLIGIEVKKFMLYKISENYELEKKKELIYQFIQPCTNEFYLDIIIFGQYNEFSFILINQYINIYI